MSEEHNYYDEDVEYVKDTIHGKGEYLEIGIKECDRAIILHIDDIVHMAKKLGLIVFDKESVL